MRRAQGLHEPDRQRAHLYASHETIYRGIRELPHGAERAALTRLLRRSTGGRRPRRASARYTGLQDITPIEKRPREAESRQTLGHWEGDLIKGAGNRSAVGTLVERASRLVLLVPLRSASADDVLAGFTRALRKLPASARRSLTYDRGSEMARHRELSAALDMPIFFCPPYRPGARATNENTNGLLRQYLPKGTDLSVHTPAELAAIERLMNDRPRRILKFQTPRERFKELLAASRAASR
jgi:transposase, IS30 family